MCVYLRAKFENSSIILKNKALFGMCAKEWLNVMSWHCPDQAAHSHGELILSRSNNSMFLQLKIYRNR